MISYEPLWATMKSNGITNYALIKQGFSRGTLDSLKKGRAITTTTLDDLCRLLDCRVEEVLEYIEEKSK